MLDKQQRLFFFFLSWFYCMPWYLALGLSRGMQTWKRETEGCGHGWCCSALFAAVRPLEGACGAVCSSSRACNISNEITSSRYLGGTEYNVTVWSAMYSKQASSDMYRPCLVSRTAVPVRLPPVYTSGSSGRRATVLHILPSRYTILVQVQNRRCQHLNRAPRPPCTGPQ